MSKRYSKTLPQNLNAPKRRAFMGNMGQVAAVMGLSLALRPWAGVWAADNSLINKNIKTLAVRVWPAPDYTRVTLELEKNIAFRYFLLKNPNRLVVDLEAVILDSTLSALQKSVLHDDPYIVGMRAAQYNDRTVRLVIDLKKSVLPQVFSAPPVAHYQYRFFIDLYPEVEEDPLMALLQIQAQMGGEGQEVEETAHTEDSATQSSQSTKTLTADPLDAIVPSENKSDAPVNAQPHPKANAVKLPSLYPSLDKIIADIQKKNRPATAPVKPIELITAPNQSIPPLEKPPLEKTVTAPKASNVAAPNNSPQINTRYLNKRSLIVVLDPGHGGEDPGAIGPSGSYEKNIVLAIARLVRQQLMQQGITAVLTRDSDFFIPLGKRVQKARSYKADVFLSIHADAFIQPHASGSSIYVVSDKGASSAAAKWMANQENGADLVGGFRMRSDAAVAETLLDLAQSRSRSESTVLAQRILKRLQQVNDLHKKQVEKAEFAVLKAPDFPSTLIETAFISNPTEERRLKTPAYQAAIALAITQGVGDYRRGSG